jgi:hypothetical protein
MEDLGESLTTEGVGGTMVVRHQCRQDKIWATACMLKAMVGAIPVASSISMSTMT